jgi:thymidylate synthase
MIRVSYIREQFSHLLMSGEFVIDKTGVKTIEIVNASFIADSPLIFGAVNEDYVRRESEWYASMSLSVNDIPGGAPQIWKQVACRDGLINSNYGWCIWSKENGNQFDRVVQELTKNPDSRRAVMIYTRPSMWVDYNYNGRSDFMCTNSVQYLIRRGKLNAVVQMRSNDVVFGYRNDRAWQLEVLEKVCEELNANSIGCEVGDIYWNVGSLHVYERHFYLVHNYTQTGEQTITKEEYDARHKHLKLG